MSRRKIGPYGIRPWSRKRGDKPTHWELRTPASVSTTGAVERKFFDTLKQAIDEATRRYRRSQLNSSANNVGGRAGVLFYEAVDGWRDDEILRVQSLEKRQNSLKTNLGHVKHLLAFFADKDVGLISEGDVKRYKAERLQVHRPRTINSELTTLRMILHWCVTKGHLTTLPGIRHAPTGRRKDVATLTEEEIALIVAELATPVRAMGHLLGETGCRWSEARFLTRDDIDEGRCLIHIRAKDGFTPKNSYSERPVPISRGLRDKLMRHLRQHQSEWVFPGKDPRRPINNFRKSLASAVRRADIRRNGVLVKVSPHVFRKSVATCLHRRGVPLVVIQRLLGHAPGSRVTLQFYTFASDEQLRQAIVELPTVSSEPESETGNNEQQGSGPLQPSEKKLN